MSTQRELITSGVIWCDIGHVDLLNLFYSSQDIAIDKLERRGLINSACQAHQAKMSQLTSY